MKKHIKVNRKRKWSWESGNVRQTVKAHGPFEIELKLAHIFKPGHSINLDVIAFAPPGLHIPEEHLDPLVALGSIKTYLRKETPKLDFNPTDNEPGKELKQLIEISKNWNDDVHSVKMLRKNFKLYATSYRKFIKGQTLSLRKSLKNVHNEEEGLHKVRVITSRTKWNWAHYRKWWEALELKISSHPDFEIFQKIDQYSSDQYSLFLLRSIQNIDGSSMKLNVLDIKTHLENELAEENNFRNKRGCPLFSESDDAPIEHEEKIQHLYAHSLTKKHVDSSLFFFTEPISSSSDSAWFAVIAAFFAMILYLIPLVAIQMIFDLEINTGMWVFAATVLYILKDRTKEVIRKKLQNAKKNKLAHRKMRLKDGEETLVGESSEYLNYPTILELNSDIVQNRYKGRLGALQKSMSNFEQVQHYSKTLKIRRGLSRPAVSVVEIIRMDLHSWLQKADAARVQYSVYSEKDQTTNTERIERAYHFHFLIKISEQEGANANPLASNQIPWEHIEVVANRDGVLNISPVYK